MECCRDSLTPEFYILFWALLASHRAQQIEAGNADLPFCGLSPASPTFLIMPCAA